VLLRRCVWNDDPVRVCRCVAESSANLLRVVRQSAGQLTDCPAPWTASAGSNKRGAKVVSVRRSIVPRLTAF
jgi:hypothetical protein